MAIIIPSPLVKLAQSVTLTLDASKLGPRQQDTYRKVARSGAIAGSAPPHLMAQAARRAAKLPTFRLGQYGYLSWDYSPFADEGVRRTILNLIGELTLAVNDDRAYVASYVEQLADAAERNAPNGRVYLSSELAPIVKRHLARIATLPALELVPEIIAVDLIDEKVPS